MSVRSGEMHDKHNVLVHVLRKTETLVPAARYTLTAHSLLAGGSKILRI